MTRRARPRLRAFLRDTAAATAVEFALVLPLFLLVTIGTINMGLAMSALVRLHFATEHAARCLSTDVSGACTAGNIDTYAKSLYQIGSMSNLSFTTTAPACGNQVNGSGDYELLTGVGLITINMTAQACYPVLGGSGFAE